MTPQEKQKMQELERRIIALERVENVSFIANVNRKIDGVTSNGENLSTASILRSVNEGGAASYSVAKEPDDKIQISVGGVLKYIGVYDS